MRCALHRGYAEQAGYIPDLDSMGMPGLATSTGWTQIHGSYHNCVINDNTGEMRCWEIDGYIDAAAYDIPADAADDAVHAGGAAGTHTVLLAQTGTLTSRLC